jgi:seryl-tRNA synthetase
MAVTPEIGVGNLELQQQLNNLIAERTKILEQHNAIMTSHNQLIAAMSSKLKEQQDAAGGAAKANTDVNNSLEELAKSSKTATSSIGTLGSSFKKLSCRNLLSSLLKYHCNDDDDDDDDDNNDAPTS